MRDLGCQGVPKSLMTPAPNSLEPTAPLLPVKVDFGQGPEDPTCWVGGEGFSRSCVPLYTHPTLQLSIPRPHPENMPG